MKTISKVLAAALVLSTAAVAIPAQAGEGWANAQGRGGHYSRGGHHGGGNWRGGYRPYYGHRHNDAGAAVAAGIAGVVIGSAIVGGLNNPPPPSYGYYDGPAYVVDPYPDVYVASSDAESWVGSQEWYDYCSSRYRTFDPRTGTFMHVSGVRKLCQ